MQIETQLRLNHLEVYVMREFEAEKKLTLKDPKYAVGPTRITQLDVTQATGLCSSLSWFDRKVEMFNASKSLFPDSL